MVLVMLRDIETSDFICIIETLRTFTCTVVAPIHGPLLKDCILKLHFKSPDVEVSQNLARQHKSDFIARERTTL